MSSSRGQSSTSPQSSTRSSTNSSSRTSSSRANGHPAVESAVTRLLVSIKQLLESLTKWSALKISENDVSDVYVRLGNDFNAAVAAFSAFGIDMAELMSVPDDLRTVLEQCLAEDATPDNLAIYLPTVRQIITNLLQGLRGKQSIYRRIVSDLRHRSESSGHERTASESRRSTRSHRSQPSISRGNGDEERRDTPSRRPTGTVQPPPSTSRRRTDESFVGGFSPSVTQGGELPLVPPPPTEPPPPPPPPTQAAFDRPTSPPVPSAGLQSPPLVPPDVKRYSLTDKPVPTPNVVVVEPSSPDHPPQQQPAQNGSTPPPPETPPPPPPIDTSQGPAVASSLAALKKSDTLERRASKRFSTYNISKMTGSGVRDRARGASSSGNRRSLLAVSSALTPGELAALTEADDEDIGNLGGSLRREGSSRSRRTPNASRAASPDRDTPPVPPLPTSPSRTPEPTASPTRSTIALDPTLDSSKITVFLQLGREVKKVNIEQQGLSLSSLRVLFVDKFSYNPGLENFPAIYIRDPSSGVQYELEDIDEVKEKCLLSLNIEPLDQIKQHIDAQISTLSQDLKELRMAVSTNTNTNNRHSLAANISLSPADSTPAARPSDRQFQQVARRLSRFVNTSNNFHGTSFSTPTTPVIQAQMTGQSLQPQMTGGSVLSDYSSRVMTDLKTQFDEVQNLRRDLGIMRQLYSEFMKQTKESLGSLRSQTQNVKQLANTNIGGARAFIDSGKSKLDVRSQNLLTEVEKLQDTVEGLKDDVLKRHITPKAQFLKTTKKDIEGAAKELASLKEHIQTIKPMWKKTWEEELQNIVEEQQFLTHQEEFMTDLVEDYNAVLEVFGHVEQVIGIRGSTSGKLGARGRSFRPVANGEESGGLTSVMMEIRGAQVDPEKRLKAIEAVQKNREKDLASRTDELQTELTEFVGQKKLRMTGGAEEVERVRQKRNDLTLRQMFTGGGAELPPMPSPELNGPTSAS